MARMPQAEVEITPALVERLLAEQHPDLLGGRELAILANGWDNTLVRLGEDLLVRLPRRQAAAELVEHEQAWLPRLAPRLPVPVPAPVRVGEPAAGYPWRWSVLPWVSGRTLASVPAGRRGPFGAPLGAFLAALHTPADADVWRNPFRGGALGEERVARVTERLEAWDGPRRVELLARWRGVQQTPEAPDARLWVHGDLHPLNVLVEGDTLAAVIDWGDLTAGDPACDLAVAWLGLDAEGAAALRTAYDHAAAHDLDRDHLWARAEGWAFHLATMLLASNDDHPELEVAARQGVTRLTERAIRT